MTDLRVLEQLSVHEKAAQVVFPRLGSNMPPPVRADDDAQRVRALIGRWPFGGLIVFNGDFRSTPSVLADLQRQSRLPLLVATDMEAGLGQQFAGATVFPHALAFSRTGPDAASLAEKTAQIAAREALAAGVHIALAPVADVHRNPRNPIISSRAWSSDPREAGILSSTYARTVQTEGLLATAKHFPGHGGTADDSHVDLPVSNDSRELLEATDLLPFRMCLDAGVSLVMTAHVAFPALDSVLRPATLSRPILQGLLRDQMGFKGAIISDSMMMKGVHKSGPGANVQLLAAGADILLDPTDPVLAVEEIVDSVASGVLPLERLDEAVRRVDRLRAVMRARHGDAIFTDPLACVAAVEPDADAHREVAEAVAQKALSATGDVTSVRTLLRNEDRNAVVAVVPSTRSAPLTQPFEDAVEARAPHLSVVRLEPTDEVPAATRAILDAAEFVVLAVFVRPAAWHTYGLSRSQHEIVTDQLKRGRSYLVLLGNEDYARSLPGAPTLFVHSDMAPSQRAAVNYLLGQDA